MNLILICIDTLRKDHIGSFGNPWIRTPNLDKFFEQSIVFDRFLPNAIPTIPLRRGLMLGRPVYPFVDDSKFPFGPMGWQPMGQAEVTLAETLRNAGYVTSMVVDPWHYFFPGMNFHKGFHTWEFVRGQEGDPLVLGPTHQDPKEFFDEKMSGTYFQNFYEQFIRNVDARKVEEDHFAPRLFTAAEKWLHVNAHYYDKFFLYIDCFDPHEPWDPPGFYTDLYDPGYKGKEYVFPETGPCDHMTESEIKHVRAMYAGKVTMVDRWFGHFMEKFELMGLDKDTMVLVFSDHGILLGEHGLMKKKNSFLYSELLDNPMMLRIPGGPIKEKRLNGLVHEGDIAPTFLRQLGVDLPESMTGLDFWPLITGEKETLRDYAIGGFGDWAYVQDDHYHYFRGLTGKTEVHLYDIQTDPAMKRNLCEERSDVVKVMEEKMTEGLKGWSPPDNLIDGRLPQPSYSPLPLKSDS